MLSLPYFYMITHRYREAGEYYQKAVDLQPDHWQAQLELGHKPFAS